MKKIFTILLCFSLFLIPALLTGCKDDIKSHTIFLTSENQRLGDVIGSGTYLTDKEVTIEAKVKQSAPQGTEFILWLKDGKIASYANPYKFNASKETEGKYTAVFSYDYLKLVQLSNIAFTQNLEQTSTLQSIKNIKLYVDNKEYFQPLVLEDSEIYSKQLDNTFSISKTLESNYIFNSNEYFYGSVELEYEVNKDETKVITTSFIQKLIDESTLTIEIDISALQNETEAGKLILTFKTVAKQIVNE